MQAVAVQKNKVDYTLLQDVKNLASFIGNTPLKTLHRIHPDALVNIHAKLEWMQLGGSVKARAAYGIIKDAVQKGELGFGRRLLDATSGNTGIAYAAIGAAVGIPVTLCVPANISEDRLKILKAYNAELKFSSRLEGTDGAQLLAKELQALHPGKYYYADQYANDNNWKAHYQTTAEEIWQQTHGQVTHLVIGLGTSGTFMGTARRLKELKPSIQLIALQPNNPMHGLEGWKHMETAIQPKFYNASLADRFLEVDTQEAFDLVKEVAKKEGLLISPSAAANLLGARIIASEESHAEIVTSFADNAEKYTEVMNKLFNK